MLRPCGKVECQGSLPASLAASPRRPFSRKDDDRPIFRQKPEECFTPICYSLPTERYLGVGKGRAEGPEGVAEVSNTTQNDDDKYVGTAESWAEVSIMSIPKGGD